MIRNEVIKVKYTLQRITCLRFHRVWSQSKERSEAVLRSCPLFSLLGIKEEEKDPRI